LTLQQAWTAVAILFTIFAAIAGFVFLRLKWVSGVDFDIIGFFWVIRNMGRLSVLVMCILCAAAAVSFWIRSYWAGR
jgi:hypothetical protein